jgi:methyltransferase (TIGR00027 family)
VKEGRASRTALAAAARRAIHQLVDEEPKVFTDPVAVPLVEAAGRGTIAEYLQGQSPPDLTSSRAGWLLRSRFAEDELAAAAAQGVRQYVILGAGLDTFAYRQPSFARDLRIFEVDHPDTQAWKRTALAVADISVPPNLAWTPVDFERETLAAGLAAAGFDSARPAFFSWLGVTQYLSLPAIDTTLRLVATLPHPSTIVLTFVLPDEALTGEDLQRGQEGARMYAARGEPWLSRIGADELRARLLNLGFAHVVHLTPEEATARYFAGRRDGMCAPHLEQLMSAVV